MLYFIQGAVNFSSSQPQLQLPDNRTIQNSVMAYVDTYLGLYTWNSTGLHLWILQDSEILLPWTLFDISIEGRLNLSSSQTQPQPPAANNRTIQNFVKDYVDEYIS